jgi:hypothetical protein
MDSRIPTVSDHVVDIGDNDVLIDIQKAIEDLTSDCPASNSEKVAALLRVSQQVNRALTELKKREDPSAGESKEMEAAVSELLSSYIQYSEEGISKTLDAILNNDELFADAQISYPIEADDELLARVREQPASSAIYTPRQPRLPGLPDPPGDQFGQWDEYRDDLDPGYRVREVYEDDDNHSQSTSITNLNTAVMFDDELQHVSHVSSVGPACMDENDELTGAASSIAASQTPSLVIPDFRMTESQQSDRAGIESPTFGGNPEKVIPYIQPQTATSYVYDYMRSHTEVPRVTIPVQMVSESRLETLTLPVIYASNRTGFEPSKEFESSIGTIVAGKYRIVSFLGSAAFSKCVKAVDLGNTNKEVCLKIIKNEKDFIDQSLD